MKPLSPLPLPAELLDAYSDLTDEDLEARLSDLEGVLAEWRVLKTVRNLRLVTESSGGS